jgi:hypothetical protein
MADKQTYKAKVSKTEQYLKKIQPYNDAISELLKEEEKDLGVIKEGGENCALKRVGLAEMMLNLASNYLVINGVSQAILKTKNEDALNEGRKAVYKSVVYLEDTVGSPIDVAFSEYAEKLTGIETLDAAGRYNLARKMGLTIRLLEDAYGINTKWKWSFVELEGRYALVTRNLLDLKKAAANWDPRSPDYRPMMYHFRLIKKLFIQAANRCREKYEMVTQDPEDFRTGILFLSALQRFLAQMGERQELETARKKHRIWTAKLEADVKNRMDLDAPKTIQWISPP